ncbi:MAG: hypothetical protein WCS43_06115 [Verrucomicrobiota bacterium]
MHRTSKYGRHSPPLSVCVHIRRDGPHAGSNFDYDAEITEMILLGVIAVRFGGHIEYAAAQMDPASD